MRRLLTILLCCFTIGLMAKGHPNLIITKKDVVAMRAALGNVPLFDSSLEKARIQVDAELALGIDVPIPKDLAGGYTHERHKANFFTMQKAGVLFQITEEEKYAVYIRDMLLAYAEIFPTFDKHPAERSYARGKFFWQCLNDANWLVYTSQAYDNIYDWLDKKTVKKLNTELFRPYAEYISIENPQFFNRIHNHSTWGNAAVGMIGMVMDDEQLVQWALYGLDTTVPGDVITDNDGGSIQLKGQKEAGFFAQLDHSFSPSGYYTEGPYYQRYAMYPFLIFSQAIQNQEPKLEIFKYRDDLLINAVYALIDLSNSDDEFFPFNDAQKGMSLSSNELVTAVSMAYYYGNNDSSLLSLVIDQDRVPLEVTGLSAAQGIADGKATEYVKKSRLFFDGKDGNEGAIAILRSTDESDLTLVMKYAKHGMGHGHFDQLGFMLYDGGNEVFQDYGAARWVNIEHKDGGGYLTENKTWAKQTVAHNSIVVNKTSQFKGNVGTADEHHGEHLLFDTLNANVQVISAENLEAYDDWKITRTMAMIKVPEMEEPLILDLMGLNSKIGEDAKGIFEMPFYYGGELMSTNLEVRNEAVLQPMGESDGYQHLWKEAEASVRNEDNFKMTWFNGDHFYSMTAAAQKGDKVAFTRIGANDPNFNLRRDPGIIIERSGGNTLFAQVYEIHGSYNTATEKALNSFSSVEGVSVLHQSSYYNAVSIELTNGSSYTFCIGTENTAKDAHHTLVVNGKELSWDGAYNFYKN